MVFISFPNSTTSEEESLIKKYEKLQKKRRSLEKAAKPKPEIVATTNNKPLEAKDAKKVIEKLKQSGQLPQIINTNRKSEFKRKIPLNTATTSANKQSKVSDEKREVVSYDEDDLFSTDTFNM